MHLHVPNRLKTPPATPLFPSLEMEPNAKLVVQKELPIAQLISRVSIYSYIIYIETYEIDIMVLNCG